MLANYSYDDYNIHTSKKCILIDKSNLKEITMNNPTDNNEKLMGLLAYLLAPIIGIIILEIYIDNTFSFVTSLFRKFHRVRITNTLFSSIR